MFEKLIRRIAERLDNAGIPYMIIIHKMVAGRPVDHEDVRHLLTKNRPNLDLDYIRQWLAQFSEIPDYEHVSRDFERLLTE